MYVHIIPSNISNELNDKYYVGLTKNKCKYRWMNGNGYKDQYFYKFIKKYGWENIDHNIVASNLTRKEAIDFEKVLIFKLNSTNSKYGYNISRGGDAPITPVKDLKNLRFGKIKVYNRAKDVERTNRNLTAWNCVCDCGNKGVYTTEELMRKNRIDCGCERGNKTKLQQQNLYNKYLKIEEYDNYFIYKFGIKNHTCVFDMELIDLIKNKIIFIRNGRLYIKDNYLIDDYKSIYQIIYNDSDLHIKHINKNKFDFRKCNLKIELIKKRIKPVKNQNEILKYDINGKYISSYKSITDASIENSILKCNISSCIKGRTKTAGGYIWRSKLESCTDTITKILKFDLNANILKEYNSLNEAHLDSQISKSTIYSAINSHSHYGGGFLWSKNEKISPYSKSTKPRSIYVYDSNNVLIKKYDTLSDASIALKMDKLTILKYSNNKELYKRRNLYFSENERNIKDEY